MGVGWVRVSHTFLLNEVCEDDKAFTAGVAQVRFQSEHFGRVVIVDRAEATEHVLSVDESGRFDQSHVYVFDTEVLQFNLDVNLGRLGINRACGTKDCVLVDTWLVLGEAISAHFESDDSSVRVENRLNSVVAGEFGWTQGVGFACVGHNAGNRIGYEGSYDSA